MTAELENCFGILIWCSELESFLAPVEQETSRVQNSKSSMNIDSYSVPATMREKEDVIVTIGPGTYLGTYLGNLPIMPRLASLLCWRQWALLHS